MRYNPLVGRLYNSKNLKELKRKLRRDQTTAEGILWEKLRKKRISGYKFYRQYSIGNYILDFYCPKLRVGIEVDGGYHDSQSVKDLDEYRTRTLEDMGVKIIRFTNEEVLLDINKVMSEIKTILPL